MYSKYTGSFADYKLNTWTLNEPVTMKEFCTEMRQCILIQVFVRKSAWYHVKKTTLKKKRNHSSYIINVCLCCGWIFLFNIQYSVHEDPSILQTHISSRQQRFSGVWRTQRVEYRMISRLLNPVKKKLMKINSNNISSFSTVNTTHIHQKWLTKELQVLRNLLWIVLPLGHLRAIFTTCRELNKHITEESFFLMLWMQMVHSPRQRQSVARQVKQSPSTRETNLSCNL